MRDERSVSNDNGELDYEYAIAAADALRACSRAEAIAHAAADDDC